MDRKAYVIFIKSINFSTSNIILKAFIKLEDARRYLREEVGAISEDICTKDPSYQERWKDVHNYYIICELDLIEEY